MRPTGPDSPRRRSGCRCGSSSSATPIRKCATRATRTPIRCRRRYWSIRNSNRLSDALEEGWEGCLSVPGLRGIVERYCSLRYRGFDLDGRPIERVASGFHARVVQHECDHLDGILYPMRVKDFTRFGFTEVLFPELAEPAGRLAHAAAVIPAKAGIHLACFCNSAERAAAPERSRPYSLERRAQRAVPLPVHVRSAEPIAYTRSAAPRAPMLPAGRSRFRAGCATP